MLEEDLCWERFAARDRGAEGAFVAAVVSTGIFCRPGCPARTPLRRNVRFYPNAMDAMAAGFRPCRRCQPLAKVPDVGLATVAALCRVIEERADEPLDLATLAGIAGYSVHHFQRRFRALVGLSPREYHAAVRARAFRRALRAGGNATQAIHAAGYGSTSRVYGAGGPLGVTPTEYQREGEGMELSWTIVDTDFGPLLVAASARGVAFTAFGNRERALGELEREYPRATLVERPGDGGELALWSRAISEHLAGRRPDPRLPVDVQGTAFQQLVWDYLRTIPAGETRTYTQVADGVGRPSAVRAAASACGANRVSVLIPCHRVIRGDGGLGGYRWGLEVKRALLAREGETSSGRLDGQAAA